jgi:hypothetical protein
MGLTWKQRQFCRLVACGTPQTVAYEETYGHRGGKRRTRQVQANQLAHKPHVAAQIQAYEEQFVPVADYRAVKQQMFENLRSLATQSPNHKVRLAATATLLDLCERNEAKEPSLRTVHIDALIAEIAEVAPQPWLDLKTPGESGRDGCGRR